MGQFGVVTNRNSDGSVRLSLVTGGVLEPQVEAIIPGRWCANPDFARSADESLSSEHTAATSCAEFPVDADDRSHLVRWVGPRHDEFIGAAPRVSTHNDRDDRFRRGVVHVYV